VLLITVESPNKQLSSEVNCALNIGLVAGKYEVNFSFHVGDVNVWFENI